MDTTRLARLLIANIACFLAFWIARLAIPWWFGIPAAVTLNLALLHRNQKLFRIYHGLQTCCLVIYFAVTAGNHTTQELMALLLLAALFAVFFWFAGHLVIAAESPAHFLRISILSCCYAVFGNTDPLISVTALTLMLAASLLPAVTRADQQTLRKLLPSLLILACVFLIALVSPFMQMPTLPRIAVWLFPRTPSSTPKPSGPGSLPVTLPPYTLQRILREFFWQLFGFLYLPLIIMGAILAAAVVLARSLLHYSWGRTLRILIFPITLVATAILFAAIYTTVKTKQISAGIQQGTLVPGENIDDLIDRLRSRHLLPERNSEIRATLQSILTVIYWMGASILLISIVTSIRDLVFEVRHEVLLSMLDRSERRKVTRAVRRLASLEDAALLEDPATSVTALFAMAVETVATLGPRLQRGETAREFSMRAAAEAPPCAAPLSRLSELFDKARYSRSSVTGDDVMEAKVALEQLRSLVRTVQRERHVSAVKR